MNKIKSIFNWFKKLFYIVNNYDKDLAYTHALIQHCNSEIKKGVQIIKDRTNIHADVHIHKNHPSEVIMIGRYNNMDYIQTFSIENDHDFVNLVSQLRDMEKYGVVQRVDAPLMLKAHIMQDLEFWRD